MTKKDFITKSDEELMELYKTDNSVAFEVLFQRHSGRVLGYIKRRISKDKDSHDVLQDVFVKLHRSRHLYDSRLPFSPWLFSISKSVLLDNLKRKRLEYPTEPEKIESHINLSQADNADLSSDSRGVALEVLNGLPEAQKTAVRLRVIDEATFEEIALKLSISPDNARQMVSRGVRKLRDLLGTQKKE